MNEIPAGVPEAAPWSMFAGTLGRGSVLASVVFFVIALLAMVAARRISKLDKIGVVSFVLGCVSLFVAFGALTALFVRDQFQYQYVWSHSDTTTSLAYKVASVWTAQEGSFLLWGCGSAVFALLALAGTGAYKRGFVGVYSLFLACIGGILAYETPFENHNA
ncbi:hypothetical protein EON82_05365, partial [bacterium]